MFKSGMSFGLVSGEGCKVVLVSECVIFYILGEEIKGIFPNLRDKVFLKSGQKRQKRTQWTDFIVFWNEFMLFTNHLVRPAFQAIQFQNWQLLQAYKKDEQGVNGAAQVIIKGLQEILVCYGLRKRSLQKSDFIWEKKQEALQFLFRINQQTQMAECTLNKRQLYKNQKLEETDEIFYCQCGKNYLTFSALYLHARNKHNYKFTTKRSHEVCKVQTIENKSIVTYFLNPQTNTQSSQPIIENCCNSQKQNQCPSKSFFQAKIELVQCYIDQHKLCLNLAELQILSHFKNYLYSLDRLWKEQKIEQIKDLTLCYNDFATFYMPLQCASQLDSSEQLIYLQNCLVKLWFWLKKNHHTQCELLTLSEVSRSIERKVKV